MINDNIKIYRETIGNNCRFFNNFQQFGLRFEKSTDYNLQGCSKLLAAAGVAYFILIFR
jgi:hypothetical protein